MIPTGVFRFTHIFRKETLKHLQLATFFATGLQMIDFLLYILITYNKLRDICDSVPFTKVVVIQCIQSSLTVMNLCYFLSLFLVCLELNYEIPCADNLLNTVITTSAVTLRMFTTAWKQANCGGFSKTPPSTPFSFDKQFPNLRQYLESRQLFRRHNHHQQHQEMLPFQKKVNRVFLWW